MSNRDQLRPRRQNTSKTWRAPRVFMCRCDAMFSAANIREMLLFCWRRLTPSNITLQLHLGIFDRLLRPVAKIICVICTTVEFSDFLLTRPFSSFLSLRTWTSNTSIVPNWFITKSRFTHTRYQEPDNFLSSYFFSLFYVISNNLCSETLLRWEEKVAGSKGSRRFGSLID